MTTSSTTLPASRPTGRVHDRSGPGRLPLLSVALLVLVAGIHAGLRATTDLSPWKGGGFAMFSSIDAPGTRVVRISIVTSDQRVYHAFVPGELEERVGRLRTVSSAAQTRSLARDAAAMTWWTADDVTTFASPDDLRDEPGIQPLPGTNVRVDVLHTHYDSATAEVRLELVHHIVVPTASPILDADRRGQ